MLLKGWENRILTESVRDMKIVHRARDGGPGEITPIIVCDRMRWTNTARRGSRSGRSGSWNGNRSGIDISHGGS